MNNLALIKQIAERLQSERADQLRLGLLAAYTLKQEYIEIENNLNNDLIELDFNN